MPERNGCVAFVDEHELLAVVFFILGCDVSGIIGLSLLDDWELGEIGAAHAAIIITINNNVIFDFFFFILFNLLLVFLQ